MKPRKPSKAKRKREDLLSHVISPGLRFFTGICCLILFIFIHQPILHFFCVLLFGVLAWFSGKRISWLYFLSFLFFVVFFHLLSPFGLVLFRIGPFSVTSGALQSGLDKGFVFIGFVFNSLFSVESNLKIPGSFGRLVSRMFIFFENLYEEKNTIRIKTLLPDIDEVLSKTWNRSTDQPSVQQDIPLRRSLLMMTGLILLFGSIKFCDWFFF